MFRSGTVQCPGYVWRTHELFPDLRHHIPHRLIDQLSLKRKRKYAVADFLIRISLLRKRETYCTEENENQKTGYSNMHGEGSHHGLLQSTICIYSSCSCHGWCTSKGWSFPPPYGGGGQGEVAAMQLKRRQLIRFRRRRRRA